MGRICVCKRTCVCARLSVCWARRWKGENKRLSGALTDVGVCKCVSACEEKVWGVFDEVLSGCWHSTRIDAHTRPQTHQPSGGGPVGIDHRHFSVSAQNQRERERGYQPNIHGGKPESKPKTSCNQPLKQFCFWFLAVSANITQYSTRWNDPIYWFHRYFYLVIANWFISVWSSWLLATQTIKSFSFLVSGSYWRKKTRSKLLIV